MAKQTISVMLDLGILGERDCDIAYSYYAGEAATREYPGCPAEYEFYSIKIDGDVEIKDLLTIPQFKEIEQIIEDNY